MKFLKKFENANKLSYLEDMFYTDSNGLVQHRTNREPKDKQYATLWIRQWHRS